MIFKRDRSTGEILPVENSSKSYLAVFFYDADEDLNKPYYKCPYLYNDFDELQKDFTLSKKVREHYENGGNIVIRHLEIQE